MAQGEVVSINGVEITRVNENEIMILELLKVIDCCPEDIKTGVISYVNNDTRPLKKDTAQVLFARGFNVDQIPKLSNYKRG